MKRLIALLLALVMVIGLAACGKPGDEPTNEPTPPVSEPTAPVDEPTDPVDEPTDPVDEPPAVELSGVLTQVVTVDLMGNDVPVTIVRNFDTGAYRIDYQFMGNDVYAAGVVLEDGTWQIDDTNNDFTFGTIEAILPVIDDSAWVAYVPELSGTMSQVVTVDLMGNAVPVTVVRNFDTGAYRIDYQFMGNDVYAAGVVLEDGTWQIDDTNNDFTFGTIEAILPVINDAAWTPCEDPFGAPSDDPVDEPPAADANLVPVPDGSVMQVAKVNMMGTDVDVTIIVVDHAFHFSYGFMENPYIYADGTIDADGNWTVADSNAPFISGTMGLLLPAIKADAWTAYEGELPVGIPSDAPVTPPTDEPATPPADEPVDPPAEVPAGSFEVEIDVMGDKIPVTVTLGEGTFELNYSMMGNAVNVKGTIGADGTWTMTEATNPMASNIVPLVQAAVAANAPSDEPADEPADAPAADGMVVSVDLMGDSVPVTVILGAGTFELNYSVMGNDVNVKGTIGADGTWTMTEATNPMASNMVPLVQAACNVVVVEVDLMGDKIPVTVALGDGTFEMYYVVMGNNVSVKGTVGADGTWTMTEATNPMASNMVPLVQAAVNAQ